MDIQVLGPLRVREAGSAVLPTAAKPRKLLALLAVHAGELVPVSAMLEELWGERPPRTASTTLQTYILHLRALIAAAGGRAPKDVLRTVPGGYLLDADGGAVDVVAFDRDAAAGHRALEDGDPALASALFTAALDLWSGPALVDVPGGALLSVEARRLDEARLGVRERRIEADLRLGRHHMLISELSALVARNSRHEGLHAQFMLALYRCGRPNEALAAFQRLRAGHVRELGIEPSATLRSLHHAILTSDPALAAPVRALSAAG